MSESEDEPLGDDIIEEEEDEEEEEDDNSEDENYEEVKEWESETSPVETPSDFLDGRFDVPQLHQYVQQYHPEIKSYSYSDMYENMEKPNPTLSFLTRFEITSVLGYRALQLNTGAEPLIETDLTDSYQIAKKELEMAKLPFIIRRPLPDGTFVHVKVQDLACFF
jgi:DNA-directed RNA polymerase I, II, and III subunit RPABC2